MYKAYISQTGLPELTEPGFVDGARTKFCCPAMALAPAPNPSPTVQNAIFNFDCI